MSYTFKENQLDYETYYILRKSVKWNNWSREQAEIALVNSYYTVTVFDNKVPIGMGRVVGDGIYFMIMDIVVRPEYQRMGIGSAIIHMFLEYIEKNMCVGSRVSVQLISEPDKDLNLFHMSIADRRCGRLFIKKDRFMRIGKQEKSLTYIFTLNKIKVNNTKQERTKKVQETRYKIIRIDEEDYGCEERPDDHVPMVSVLVKAIEPDDFGDFPERIIMMEDEIMYRRNLDEGDEAVIGLDGGLFPPGMFCNEVDDGENDTKADLQGEWLEDYLDALEEMEE